MTREDFSRSLIFISKFGTKTNLVFMLAILIANLGLTQVPIRSRVTNETDSQVLNLLRPVTHLPLELRQSGKPNSTSLMFQALKSLKNGGEPGLAHIELTPEMRAFILIHFIDEHILPSHRSDSSAANEAVNAYLHALFPFALQLKRSLVPPFGLDSVETLARRSTNPEAFLSRYSQIMTRAADLSTIIGIYHELSQKPLRLDMLGWILENRVLEDLSSFVSDLASLDLFIPRSRCRTSTIRNEYRRLENDTIYMLADTLTYKYGPYEKSHVTDEDRSFVRIALAAAQALNKTHLDLLISVQSQARIRLRLPWTDRARHLKLFSKRQRQKLQIYGRMQELYELLSKRLDEEIKIRTSTANCQTDFRI